MTTELKRLPLANIETIARACVACRLHETRTNVVFARGNTKAPIMLVGEAPGANEDRAGKPFVGAAGKLLDEALDSVGIVQNDVYVTNVVKCRPPANRPPHVDELDACGDFLAAQIFHIEPRVIVLLGSTAMKYARIGGGLLATRGKWHKYAGIDTMVTVHPAYCLRVSDGKTMLHADLMMVKDQLGR